MSIYQVGGVAMVRPATFLYLFKLRGEPGGVPPLRVKPHMDDPVGLQRRPDFDLCLAGDFSTGVGDLYALSSVSIILPPVEGTLEALANDLHVRMVNQDTVQPKICNEYRIPWHIHNLFW